MSLEVEPRGTIGPLTVEEMERWRKGELFAIERDGQFFNLCLPPNALKDRHEQTGRAVCQTSVEVETPEEKGAEDPVNGTAVEESNSEDPDSEAAVEELEAEVAEDDYIHPFWD